MKKNQKLLLGAHMSIAGGFYKSILRGAEIGCTTIQIFTKSNRQWKAKTIEKEDVSEYLKTLKESNIFPVAAHASYLINLGSPNEDTNKKSLEALIIELERCEKLKIPYLVLHPGNGLSSTEKETINLIANNINTALKKVPGKVQLLLENMAGQGTGFGYKFEQLASVYKKIKLKSRFGICFDTCHAFAAGYDVRTKSSYEKTLKEFDKIIGLKLLKLIHINDSKKDLGSRVDRHEHIGKGKIGINGFKLLFNDQRFFNIPKILETPKESDLSEDIINLKTIVNLINKDHLKLIENLKLYEYKNK